MMRATDQAPFGKARLVPKAIILGGLMLPASALAGAPLRQPALAPAAVMVGPTAVLDGDHHRAVDANVYPWSSVGKIFNSIGGACTGFVVAVDKVATAGHCVYAFRTRRFLPPDAIHVLLGYDRGNYRFHARVARYRVGPGYDPDNERGTAAADWAVLDLAEPLPAAIRPLAPARQPVQRGVPVMIGGFARDRAYVMTTDKDCRILDAVEGGKLLSHDCLTAPGDSGAPVLLDNAQDKTFDYVGITIANWRIGNKQTGIATAAPNLILNDPTVTARPGLPRH